MTGGYSPFAANAVINGKLAELWNPAKDIEAAIRWCEPRIVWLVADLFHEDALDDFIDRVFAVMALCPPPMFLVLTKHAERMRGYFAGMTGEMKHARLEEAWRNLDRPSPAVSIWPLPKLCVGVSVEDQAAADERVLCRTGE